MDRLLRRHGRNGKSVKLPLDGRPRSAYTSPIIHGDADMTQANLADLGHEKLAQLIQDAYNEGYLRGKGDGYHQGWDDAREEAAQMAKLKASDDAEDDGYEDDGQPDEMQEWYDYDPDC